MVHIHTHKNGTWAWRRINGFTARRRRIVNLINCDLLAIFLIPIDERKELFLITFSTFFFFKFRLIVDYFGDYKVNLVMKEKGKRKKM